MHASTDLASFERLIFPMHARNGEKYGIDILRVHAMPGSIGSTVH
jgi:hypothetical protein